jgi:phospholipase A1
MHLLCLASRVAGFSLLALVAFVEPALAQEPVSDNSMINVAPATTQSAAPVVQPSTSAVDAPLQSQHTGLVEFLSNRLAPLEPIYFLIGTERPNAKFQFSIRYQVLNTDGPLVTAFEPLKGLNFGYSQTSFWDLEGDSQPFTDNSYRPEVMLLYDDLVPPARLKFFEHIGLQTGVQHESNGQGGDESRNLNFVYIRPILTIGDRDHEGLFLTVAPRFHGYFGDMENNPDIERYRGYVDLRVIVGQGGGLQAAFTGRLGSAWDKGSIQMDLTFPLRKLLFGNVDLYLQGQIFNGYGESLGYNESDTTYRVGLALVR